MKKLENKVALVTGGSRGIGAAIVHKLAADGASVAFTYSRSAEKAEKIVAEIRAGGARRWPSRPTVQTRKLSLMLWTKL